MVFEMFIGFTGFTAISIVLGVLTVISVIVSIGSSDELDRQQGDTSDNFGPFLSSIVALIYGGVVFFLWPLVLSLAIIFGTLWLPYRAGVHLGRRRAVKAMK